MLIKPAGMSSELPPRDPGSATATALAWVRSALNVPNARLPHRLDRITRGILVVAPDAVSAACLGASLAAGQWHKHYLARVRPDSRDGDPRRLVGDHTLHLRARGRRSEVVRSGGQRAVTAIIAVEPCPQRPLEMHVLLRLHTGRFHQVRATLAHLGAPVTNDPLYDAAASPTGVPYLEHIALRMPLDGLNRTFHDADDPEREHVSTRMAAAIASLLTEAGDPPSLPPTPPARR